MSNTNISTTALMLCERLLDVGLHKKASKYYNTELHVFLNPITQRRTIYLLKADLVVAKWHGEAWEMPEDVIRNQAPVLGTELQEVKHDTLF